MWPLAVDASTRTGIPAQVIFAQSALETGWGRSAPQNNYFGIKGSGGTQSTREYIGGRWVTVNDSFRGYSSMADSVDGYVDFITNPNSRRWGAARNAGTPEEAARAIAAGGYATDPNYASKLMSIIRGIPNPFQFGATATPNQSAATETGCTFNPFAIARGARMCGFSDWDQSVESKMLQPGNSLSLMGDGGLIDQMTITPDEAKENIMGGVQSIVDGLADPLKRVGVVVIGVLMIGIALFVILKGPQAAVSIAGAVITKGKSLGQSAAMEAVA